MSERVAFFLPHFGHRGAEGIVLRLLQGMDRMRHAPVLILQDRRGELLAHIPDDVPVLALRQRRLPLCIPELARLLGREGIALCVTLTNAASLYSVATSRLAGRGVATLVTEHTPPTAFLADAKLPRLRRAAIGWAFPRATLTGGPIDEIGRDLGAMLGAAAPRFVCLPNPVVDRVGALRPVERLQCQKLQVARPGADEGNDAAHAPSAAIRSKKVPVRWPRCEPVSAMAAPSASATRASAASGCARRVEWWNSCPRRAAPVPCPCNGAARPVRR